MLPRPLSVIKYGKIRLRNDVDERYSDHFKDEYTNLAKFTLEYTQSQIRSYYNLKKVWAPGSTAAEGLKRPFLFMSEVIEKGDRKL